MAAFVPERRRAERHGARLAGVVVCPRCGGNVVESFSDGEGTDFRCQTCHQRWTITLGVLIAVPDRGT